MGDHGMGATHGDKALQVMAVMVKVVMELVVMVKMGMELMGKMILL